MVFPLWAFTTFALFCSNLFLICFIKFFNDGIAAFVFWMALGSTQPLTEMR
jgi:hypothetical protein